MTSTKHLTATVLVATVLLGAALPVGAADLSQLGLSQSQVDALNAQLTAPAVAPGISFGSPVAFGAGWGQAFFGIGGQTEPKNNPNVDNVDGSASLGMGIGDPYTLVGLEGVVTAISLNNGFGEDGDVSLKLHRVLPGRSGIAIGVDNTTRWGAAKGTKAGTYAAFTKVMDLNGDTARFPVPVAFNIGVGNGRFAKPGSPNDVGVFGSLSVAPWRQVSFIADFDGRDANAGISVVPFPRVPMIVTLGAIHLGQRYNTDTEFAGGLGYLFSF